MSINNVWRRLHHYAHSVEFRAFLLSELQRARKQGIEIPTSVFWQTLRNPARYEDRIQLLRFIRPDESVLLIDVGGNTGFWSEDFLTVFPNTKIIAFEPISALFSEYQNRFRLNANVKVFQAALSDAPGEADIHVARGTGCSSLKMYADTQKDLNIEFVRTEKVKLDILDNCGIEAYRSQVSKVLLKVDVQGFEVEVLSGARGSLNAVDIVIIECSFAHEYKNTPPSFSPVCKFLLEFGFYPVIFKDFGRQLSPYAWERDVIFVREEAVQNIWGW